jgi:hypothetical protein
VNVKRILLAVLMLVPGLAAAATPSQGVELKVRRGFFTETDIGAFFTLGGNDVYSNAQSYLQLGIGYDLSDTLELGAHFGLGANAYNCFSGRTAGGECIETENFTITFFDATLAYLVPLRERLYLTPKVAVGYTLLDPSPVRRADGSGFSRGINFGAGVGVEYATAMEHLSIGADVLVRYIPVANIPAISIFPRVKYTF